MNNVYSKILIILACVWMTVQQAYCQDTLVSKAEFEAGYAIGKYINIPDYAEVGLFAPLFMPAAPYLPFIDIRCYGFNNRTWAASVGTGFRTTFDSNTIGINLYYDYRRSKTKNNFHQIGLGVEYLFYCWQSRINAYIPIGTKTHHGTVCDFDLGDGFRAIVKRLETALSGFDAEIGANLTAYCDFNLYGAVGPYYYYSGQQRKDYWGVFGRLEVDWRSILSAEVLYSFDRHHSSNVQGILRVSLPFNFFLPYCNDDPRCNYSCDFYSRPVHRNRIILTDRCCHWNWNWDDKQDKL